MDDTSCQRRRLNAILLHTVFIRLSAPGRPESGRLFESGRLLKFHHFQQVLYVEDVTSQVSVKYFDENSLFGEVFY